MKFKYITLLFVLLTLAGCGGSKVASYHYVQEQLAHNQVNFHHSLKIDEYINAFHQDWLTIPPNDELVLRIDSLSKDIPKVGENTIVQIAVKTRKPSDKEKADPVALSFVIDVSGSMDGEYIDDTKTALINSIQELNNGDIISLVTFNNESEVIASNVTINKTSRKELVQKVKEIEAGGGTNIESGLVEGYREMSKFSTKITKRLLMLTDGQSTVDNQTPQQLARKAKVEYMEGARISTIGLGIGVNESLLRNIANQGKGHYYFADTSKTLTRILREDLKSTVVPVAKNLKLDLELGSGYELINIYGSDSKNNLPTKHLSLGLGELNVDDWRIIIVELKRVSDGDTSISVSGTYFSISQKSSQNIVATTSSITNNREVDKYVLRNSILFANASALIEASKLSHENRQSEAVRILNLQINNNRVLASIDDSSMLKNELDTLIKTRDIISGGSTTQISYNPPVTTSSVSSNIEQPSTTKSLVVSGLKLAADVLPGLWSTVAKVLVVAIE